MAWGSRAHGKKGEELPPTLTRDGAPARRQGARQGASPARDRDAQGEQYAELRRRQRGRTTALVVVVAIVVVLVVVVGLMAGQGSVAG